MAKFVKCTSSNKVPNSDQAIKIIMIVIYGIAIKILLHTHISFIKMSRREISWAVQVHSLKKAHDQKMRLKACKLDTISTARIKHVHVQFVHVLCNTCTCMFTTKIWVNGIISDTITYCITFASSIKSSSFIAPSFIILMATSTLLRH